MILLNLTAGATVSGTNVGLTVALQTNQDCVLKDDNTIQIRTPGIFELDMVSNLTATAEGLYGLDLFVNDESTGIDGVADAAAEDELFTCVNRAVINVLSTKEDGFVTVRVVSVGSPNVGTGQLSIKRIS